MVVSSSSVLVFPWFRLKAIIDKMDATLAGFTRKKEDTRARMAKGVVRDLLTAINNTLFFSFLSVSDFFYGFFF